MLITEVQEIFAGKSKKTDGGGGGCRSSQSHK